MKKKTIGIIYIITVFILSSGCSESFLNEKADAGIGTPYQLSDYRAMMDNSLVVMNSRACYALGVFGGDELNLDPKIWEASTDDWQKNAYIWADDVFEGKGSEDWNRAYQRILYSNLVLEGLDALPTVEKETTEWTRVRATALFFRGLNFYQLAQLFVPTYTTEGRERKLGLPLRLSSDVNIPSERSTIQQTYEQVLDDLEGSVDLLPDKEVTTMRPSKGGGYGLLARIYLQLSEYEKARGYASKALSIQDDLINYNDLDPKKEFPFANDWGASNQEILFFNYMIGQTLLTRFRMNVSAELLAIYEENDLRRQIYFKSGTINNIYFRGSYVGNQLLFVGPTTGEMLLIRAEANARAGLVDPALQDINRLRQYRLDRSLFAPVEITDEDNLLRFVLDERKRELAFRGQRWEDLRRLNKDPRFAKKISRVFNNTVYTLEPNALKYVWPIGDDVIDRSHIEQNARY